jgi:hypothetical protein
MSSAPNADELADRLDQVLPPHAPTVPDPVADDPRVTAALRLARGPHPALDGAVVARIQAQMFARADSIQFVVRSARRPAARVLRWAIAACLVVVLLVAGTASASAQSLPGEPLYPVKRLVERGRLALAGEDGDVSLRLDFAARRLDEFETLLDQGTVNLEPLDDATQELSTTLGLVERGAGSRSEAADQLVELSQRHLSLVRRTMPSVEQDQAKADHLRTITAEVEQVEQEAHDLVSPSARSRTYDPSAPFPLSRQALHTETLVYIPHDLSLPQGGPTRPESLVFVDPTTPTPEPPRVEEVHVSLANRSGDTGVEPLVPTAEDTIAPEPTRDGRGTLDEGTPAPTDLPPGDPGTPGETATPDPVTPTEPPPTPEPPTPVVTDIPGDRNTLDEGTPTPTDLPPGDPGTPADTVTPDPVTPTEAPVTPEPPTPVVTEEPGDSGTPDGGTPVPTDVPSNEILTPVPDAPPDPTEPPATLEPAILPDTPDAGTAEAILPTPVPTDPPPDTAVLSTEPDTPPDLPVQPGPDAPLP